MIDKKVDRINFILEAISKSSEVNSMTYGMVLCHIYNLDEKQLEDLYELVLFHEG